MYVNLYERYDCVDVDIPFDEPKIIRVGKYIGGRVMTGYVNQRGEDVVPADTLHVTIVLNVVCYQFMMKMINWLY